jgi:hypothetical protein
MGLRVQLSSIAIRADGPVSSRNSKQSTPAENIGADWNIPPSRVTFPGNAEGCGSADGEIRRPVR